MKIFHIPAFTDNYIWCIQENNKLAVVDPGDSKELLNLIKDNDLILEDILIRHHHFDHTGCLDDLLKLDYVVEPAPVWVTQSDWVKEKKETGIMVTHFIENGAMHPNYPEYKVDIYKINNEINWFTGKARIKGDIWLKRVDGKKGKDPKIEILAKGNCEEQKKKF